MYIYIELGGPPSRSVNVLGRRRERLLLGLLAHWDVAVIVRLRHRITSLAGISGGGGAAPGLAFLWYLRDYIMTVVFFKVWSTLFVLCDFCRLFTIFHCEHTNSH